MEAASRVQPRSSPPAAARAGSERAWSIRAARPGDRPAIHRLMEAAFGAEQVSPAHERWQWLFRAAPAGPSVHYLVADAGAHLAGQFATVPVQLQHRGEPARGLLVVDLATDPAHQRQGVFSALAREIYRESGATAPIVLGFPNAAAAPIHYGRFDWVELRPFPFLIRPLGNVAAALREAGSRLEPVGALVDALLSPVHAIERGLVAAGRRDTSSVVALERFSAWADELWRELSPILGTCVVRDADYLNWRFCSAPFPYRRYALRRGGRTVGFAVIAFSPTRFGRLCHLMELMAPAGDSSGARLLLAHVCRDALRLGASGICAIATRRHPHRRAMLQSGFVPAPAKARAQLSFGVRRNGPGALPNELFHIDDWYLSGADRDTL